MKTVVITGAGGVLCGTLAKALAKQGYQIALLDLKKEAADQVASEINAAGGKAIGVAANVLEKESLEAAKKEVNEKLGSCDILVNGAGGNHPLGTTSNPFLLEEDLQNTTEGFKTFFDLDAEGIKFVFNLNFIGTLLPTQVFSKVGIRVNALAPGFFLTDQNRALLTTENGELTPRGNTIIGQTPMGRFGEPEDLISTTLYLCDDASSFVTGVVIPIDGGFSAFSGV
jgi:NAD(P)-dependent dehydrogenase (short-subunit alcohol dehydrogenase family)